MNNVWTVRLNQAAGGPIHRLLFIAPGDGTTLLPFELKRPFFMVNNSSPGEFTEGHSHINGWQVHFCTAGRVTFKMDDGKMEDSMILCPNGVGLVIGPGVWHSYKLERESSMMVIASDAYTEANYIRDFNKFKTGVIWKES